MTSRDGAVPDPASTGATAPELEPDAAEVRRMVDAALERIVAHFDSLADQPAADVAGARELARTLGAPLPRDGHPLPELLDRVFHLAGKSFNTAGPGYLAYIPGGGLFATAVADLVADSLNRYVGVFAAAPALAQLEANVVRWFAEIVGFPPAARGILTSGGSLANLTALITARHERLPVDFLAGTIYASDQTHHSVAKAAVLAGFPAERVRAVPVDASYRIRVDRLAELVAADRAAGLAPFLLVANAGSTNTGAVDPLPELAALAADERLWLHVDAAYGGFFLLTERGRRAMAGIERADSVVLDPHKGLFLPYGTGALLVRDGGALRRTHTFGAHYLPEMQEDAELVDFCEISPELSRPFRGLRVWLPLELYGADAFVRALDEKLDLAAWAHREVAAIEGMEIVAAPQLSTFAFRLALPAASVEERDRLNAELLAAINRRGRVYLTATRLERGFALRICVLSFRTHRRRMEACLEDIRSAVREVAGAASGEPPRG